MVFCVLSTKGNMLSARADSLVLTETAQESDLSCNGSAAPDAKSQNRVLTLSTASAAQMSAESMP